MKEALKLALDALMENEHYIAEHERHAYVVVYNKIIEKCKAALAQQEPWCMKMNGCTTKCEDCPDEPAQQCLDCGSNNIGIPATYDSLIDSVKTLQASA